MKLIDKDKVVAEIEKIIATEEESINSFEHHKNISEQVRFNARIDLLRYVLSFLDTLEVKEVDLDEELRDFIMSYRNKETGYSIDTLAEHFFELGLKAQKGE